MDPITALLLAGAGYGAYRYTKNRKAAATAAASTAAPAVILPTMVAAPNVEAATPEASGSPTRARRSDGRGLFASTLFDAV